MTIVPPGSMERHLQTVLSALVLASILGSGSVLLDLRDRVSRSEERQSMQFTNITGQVSSITAQVTAMQNQITAANSDRYTGADARRDLDAINRRLLVVEADRVAMQAATAAKAAALITEAPPKK